MALRDGGSRRVSSIASSSRPGVLKRRSVLKGVGAGIAATSFAGCLGEDDDDVISIGYLGPTGIDMGQAGARSVELAVDEINANGGILDQEVELIVEDSEGLPGTAQSEAERMVREGIDVVIGTYVTEVTEGIVDTLADANVPFLISGAADPRTLQNTVGEDYDRYKNTFRVGTVNSDFEARELVEYTEYLGDLHGWTDVAYTPESAAWTAPFTDILPDELRDRGFNVVYEEQISLDLDDWTPLLNGIEESGAQIMYTVQAHLAGPSLLAAWAEGEYPVAQEGNHVASTMYEFWDDTDGACEYEGVGDPGGAGVVPITEESIPFAERYNEAFGDSRPSMPSFAGAQAYDATYVYRDAIERAGTADAEANLDDIVDALLETDLTGATGQVRFYDPDHEYPHDVQWGPDLVPYLITQWQTEDGEPTKEGVFPEQHATADHVAPEWM